jgi:peptidoglycan/LPS O-acetylase OafA/YrhL
MDSPAQPLGKKPYFQALTGLRALAAYLVYFYHANALPAGSHAWRLVHEGHIGVTIFFVLSGFLISIRYLDRVELSRHWIAKYFRNRFARIYPMYALVTALTFLVVAYQPAYEINHAWDTLYTAKDKVVVPLLNFSFLRGFFNDFKFSGVAQGWTLTVEETYYAVAPLLLLGLVRARFRYVQLVGYALGFIALGLACVRFLPHAHGFFGTYRFMADFTFFGRCVEFMIGMALALFVRSKPQLNTYSFATWLGLAWVVACMWILSRVDDPLDGGSGTVSRVGIGVNNLVLPVGIAALLFGLIHERTWLRWLLETKTLDLLGKSSYVFYLVHQGIFNIGLERHGVESVWVRFIVLNALSILLFKLIEDPLHRLLTGKTVGAQAKPSATVAS